MRKNLLTVCGALAVAGAALAAQTPQTPSTSSAPARPAAGAGTVTVTGCLATWDDKSATSSPGATASSQAASGGTKYVLKNVQDGSSASSSTSASPSSSASSASAGSRAGTYLLKADSSVNLSAHLNHKVQVTGSVDQSAHSSTSGASSQPARPGTTASPSDRPSTASGSGDMGSSMKPATLSVSSVTMISATCP